MTVWREEGGEALGEEEEEEEEEEVIYPTLGLAPPDVDPWYSLGIHKYPSTYVWKWLCVMKQLWGRQWIIQLPSRALALS